ncbi:MAG: asparagine synthase (glutamine-hydrolyzing) [Clostridia bacterium]|nr:asparagine synthase (glutamine-hydrolyzing) [Clostridia bacterium]
MVAKGTEELMCGICGIYGRSDSKTITAMTASLAHRGPDATAVVTTARHSLGGARLHITGAADAPFPFGTGQGEPWLLLNGEIYNYRYWQKLLIARGYELRTGTDTEVAWALYKEYGPGFVKHLKGMFAIAVLDGDRLLLARDRFGIKPLFYLQRGGQLAFASEIKALLRFAGKALPLNTSALQEILTFGYVDDVTATAFQGIKQVPPGGMLVFDGRELRAERYYQLPRAFSAPVSQEDFREQALLLANILPAAMENILSHGPQEKGVFLSGGVDSTLMAALVRDRGAGLLTFSLADGDEAPDLPWSRRVAQALGSKHHEIVVTFQDYLEELPRFIYHYENPVVGGVFDLQGAVAFHLLCRQASRHVKVVLTGEGADELFGGYYWTYTHPLGFADRIYERLRRVTNYQSNPGLVRRVEGLFPQPEDETTYRLHIFDLLLQGGLANYHLWSVDRSCGAFGFEARPFYLTDAVAHFALGLPVELKVHSAATTKFLLKEVAHKYLVRYGLEEVVTRKKIGMPAAVKQLDVRFHEYARQRLSDQYLSRHPYREYLASKAEVLLFDLFYYIFFYRGGHLENGFTVQEALEGGLFESMYDH